MSAGGGQTNLDDRPLELVVSRDGKRVLVVLPYELVVLDARDLTIQRSLEIGAARPDVAEDVEGLLWIGGPHLHRGSSWGGSTTKVGSKLGGLVGRVALLRPGLLCGVGSTGEVLWDVEKEKPLHRRKVSERHVHALVATPDERAVFADGTSTAWVIDPAHPSGYSQLKFRRGSKHAVWREGIVALGLSRTGRLLLGARDGGVAWTHADLRIAHERFPAKPGRTERSTPLALSGDERHAYVLRPRGVLERYLLEPPTHDEDKRGRGRSKPSAEPEEAPPPLAETVRLKRPAEAMTLRTTPEGKLQLLVAGSHADGELGRVWAEDPEKLEWAEMDLGERELPEAPPPKKDAPAAPSFVATKNKPSGTKVASLKVDEVISGNLPFLVVGTTSAVLERPTAKMAADELLPGDHLLLPAMLRLREGTARPGLVVWPGSARTEREDGSPEPTPPLRVLAWGDKPAAWMPLETPSIREQRWSRMDVFPVQIALHRTPPELGGRRAEIPERWVDAELFGALARECKKALKVLW